MTDKYKKSDYVQESLLIIKLLFYGDKDNETKFKVFDENFVRMLYYLYEKDTPFLTF